MEGMDTDQRMANKTAQVHIVEETMKKMWAVVFALAMALAILGCVLVVRAYDTANNAGLAKVVIR